MPYKFRKKLGPSACSFIEEIIDGMQDWVRVINKENTIIFVNKSMRKALGMDIVGQKCYRLLGKTSPCNNCVSRCLTNCPNTKEEIINGRTFSVTSSPLKNNDADSEEAVVEVLHDITDLKNMSIALEAQNTLLKQDLLMAKSLQYTLLPKESLTCEKIDFSYIYKPCETLGGDFIDIFKMDEDHIGLYIADVSGHGVAASMLTMFLCTALDKSQLSPSKALSQLYKSYNGNNFFHELYIAVFYVVLDIRNNTMTYSNAGLNVCPILFSGNKYQILRVPGIPISNWLEDPGYTEVTININSKDRLFLYTDGIIEVRNKLGNQFGEERLLEHLLESDLPPQQTLSSMVQKAISFSDKGSQNDITDDITVALLEVE